MTGLLFWDLTTPAFDPPGHGMRPTKDGRAKDDRAKNLKSRRLLVIDLTRLARVAVIAATLAMPGVSAAADSPGGAPAAAAPDWWGSVRAGTAGVLGYGVQAVRSLSDWLTGAGAGADDGKTEDLHGLLNLSDKEFRDFETLVRAAGYVLQGYSLGLDGGAGDNGSGVELAFDFERMISDRERADLRRQLDQQDGAVTPVRRNVILALLDATRYTDASPASGYRLAGVTMHLGAPPDVRIKFRRIKP